MGIPNKINPMTGGNILPRGYIAADFLESDGKTAVIDSLIVPNFETGIYVKMRVWDITSGSYYFLGTQNGYGQPAVWVRCNNSALGVDYYYRNNPIINLTSLASKAFEVEINWLNSKIVKAEALTANLSQPSGEAPWQFHLSFFRAKFLSNTGYDNGSQSRFYYIKMSQGSEIVRDMIPCISPDGVGCMYDKATKQPFKNAATGAFIVGMTVSQARYLRKLPIVESGALTVSLPWEAQYDTGVQAALSIAAANGWTITVQYRDPEVATANIPIGFLEGTGTQYIYVPELVMTPDDDYEWYIAFSNYPDTGNFGIWSGSEHIRVRQAAVMTLSQYVFNFFGGELQSRTLESGKYSLSRNGLYINGSLKASIPTITSTESTGLYLFCQRYNNVPSYFAPVALSSFKVKGKFACISALDTQGVPCMYDLVTNQPFYNDGTGAFIAGFDTAAQARNLAHLPDVTAETDAAKKSLTVSLPWEAQLVITGVPAALQVAADRGWTITVQYRDPEADNEYYNRYAKCVTVADMAAVNPDYKHDLTADGDWIYPTSAIVDGTLMFGRNTSYMIRGYFYLPNMTTASDFANQGRKLIEAEVYAPNATSLMYMFHDQNNLKKISGDFSNLKNAREFVCNTHITDLVADFPSLSDAELFALNCNSAANRPQLNKTSALRILGSIPSYTRGTHRLGLGIHIDHQTDEEVIAAISAAEAKGWTLTVQWNGTATTQTASTFGLRKPPIYAKLGTVERPDGTTENVLDWGHYVTNWEENSYQEFSSIEEAEEYFNINQIEEV